MSTWKMIDVLLGHWAKNFAIWWKKGNGKKKNVGTGEKNDWRGKKQNEGKKKDKKRKKIGHLKNDWRLDKQRSRKNILALQILQWNVKKLDIKLQRSKKHDLHLEITSSAD